MLGEYYGTRPHKGGKERPAARQTDRKAVHGEKQVSGDGSPTARIMLRFYGSKPAEAPWKAFRPAVIAVIIARSGGVRCGCQMSKIRTTRSLSLSFQASCSMVSSNTHALPGTHFRVSLPTRKPQPSGMMS